MNKQHLTKLFYIGSSTFIEGVRNKVVWAIVFLATMLTFANISVSMLFSWDLGKISVEFTLSAVAFSGLLIVFFLSLKIIADDFERNRIQMLMARPIDSWHYVVGKFLGLSFLLLTTCFIIGLGGVFSQLFFLIQYPTYVPPAFSWLTYFMALCTSFLSLIIILAVTLFFYCFSSNSFVALLFSISIYFVGQNITLLQRIVNENPYAGFLTGKNHLVTFLMWIFPNLSLFDKKLVAAYGSPFTFQEFTLLVFYALTYISIILFLSSVIISKRNIGK